MPKVIALAFADLHIHKFRNFNDKPPGRLHWCLEVLRIISLNAMHRDVPVLFMGDLFHNPKEIENETMSKTQRYFYKYFEQNKIPFLAISGNHDLSEKNSIDHKSPSHLDSFLHFQWFGKMDNHSAQYEGFYIAGIPYMNNDKDVVEMEKQLRKGAKKGDGVKVLMLHGDFPGAVTPSGFKVNETEHITKETFKYWDLVLCGHIHKAQTLSDKVYMLGTPLHQDAGDEGNVNGYWEVYDNGKMKFIPIKDTPKFRTLKPGETPSNTTDYWITPEQVLEDEDSEEGEFSLSNKRDKLAKRYCKLRGVKSKAKRRALIEILNQPE